MYHPHPGIPIIRGGSINALKTFQLFKNPSGVDNLDALLTVNGTQVAPTFRYNLKDANATNLVGDGYGETLTRVSVATPPTYNAGSPGLGANDDSCKFNGSDYYKNATAVNQIGTEDFVIELVWKNVDENKYLISTLNTDGYFIGTYDSGTGNIRLIVNDADESLNVPSASSSAPDGTWNHGLVYVNRNEASVNGSWWFINGLASGSGLDMSAAEKTLVSTGFSIGDAVSGGAPSSSTLAYCAMWKATDWIQAGVAGKNEIATIAKERFLKYSGMYPQKARNSGNKLVDGDMEGADVSAWSANDSTLTKDTTAPLYEGTKHIRVTSTANTFWATQSVLQAGATYRITGAARSVSGSAVPKVLEGGAIQVWLGTTSTDWQEFDVTFTQSTGAGVLLGSATNHPGVVDFDDVTVTCLGYMPIAATRTYPAYIDKVESGVRKLYYVGNEWLRQCYRVDSAAADVKGYLPETAAENLFVQSEVFSGWTKYDAGDAIVDNAAICPDGRTVAASFAADNTNGRHELIDGPSLTVATYAVSYFMKMGTALSWVSIRNTTTGAYCFYNINTGAVGTASGGSGYIEGPFYSADATPFYRICLAFTAANGVNNINLGLSDADTNFNYSAGDGSTPNIYLWGAQIELGDYMTSPVRTAGSALTRLKDNLQFVAGDNIGGEDNGTGTIFCDILFPTKTTTVAHLAVSISDGGDSADRIMLYGTDGTYSPYVLTAATAGSGGAASITANATNNTKRLIGTSWNTDDLIPMANGASGTPDTSVGIPDDLDRIDIGAGTGGGNQMNGLIQNLRIYAEPTALG